MVQVAVYNSYKALIESIPLHLYNNMKWRPKQNTMQVNEEKPAQYHAIYDMHSVSSII